MNRDDFEDIQREAEELQQDFLNNICNNCSLRSTPGACNRCEEDNE
jgi:hypothetical protein